MIIDLYGRDFFGIVQPDPDPEMLGRYLVYIPILQPVLSEQKGIWVKNHVSTYSDNTDHSKGRYGQYFPLKAGTKVMVRFYSNDFNSGYIERILHDDIPNSSYTGTSANVDQDKEAIAMGRPKHKINVPFNAVSDRDEVYQIIRTPSENLFLIGENTSGDIIPKNSIHLYYRRNHSTLVIDEGGFNFKTVSDFNEKIKGRRTTECYDYSLTTRVTNMYSEALTGIGSGMMIKINSKYDIGITSNLGGIHITNQNSSADGIINIGSKRNIFIGATSGSSVMLLFSGKVINQVAGEIHSSCGLSVKASMGRDKNLIGSYEEVFIAGSKVTIMAGMLELKYASKVETGCGSAQAVRAVRTKIEEPYVGSSTGIGLMVKDYTEPNTDIEKLKKEVFTPEDELAQRNKDKIGGPNSYSFEGLSEYLKQAVGEPSFHRSTGIKIKNLSDVHTGPVYPNRYEPANYIKFEK